MKSTTVENLFPERDDFARVKEAVKRSMFEGAVRQGDDLILGWQRGELIYIASGFRSARLNMESR